MKCTTVLITNAQKCGFTLLRERFVIPCSCFVLKPRVNEFITHYTVMMYCFIMVQEIETFIDASKTQTVSSISCG